MRIPIHKGRKIMRVGFIGSGNMGSGMARHLLAAGHMPTTYARSDRSRTCASDFRLNLVGTPDDVAKPGKVVITIVTAGTDVKSVGLGSENFACTAHDPG